MVARVSGFAPSHTTEQSSAMCYTARWIICSPLGATSGEKAITDEGNQEQAAIQQRRADLLHRSRETHGQLDALLADLSDEEMIRPGVTDDWSVKDHLVHLTWWEQRVIRMLSGAADPIDVIPNGRDGDDTINAHVHEQNQQRSLADVRAAFDRSYQEMMDLIATAPDDVLSAKYAWISGNAAEHYDEHLRMLQVWRERGMASA